MSDIISMLASDTGGGLSNEPLETTNLIDIETSTVMQETTEQVKNPDSVTVSKTMITSVEVPQTSVPEPNSRETNSQQQTVTSTPLFSQVLKNPNSVKPVFPKRDQAIIFSSLPGISIKEYIVSLGSIVGPKNMTFASKISNNRVCIYLISKQCVDDFMANHAAITIGDVTITARRLITPASRIILSNVSPHIPHDIIETTLRSQNLKVVSPVSFIGIGVGGEFAHMCSFRRQVYIVPEENQQLPSSMLIDYEQIVTRIFLSNDELKCFVCKSEGHISKQCPKNARIQNQTKLTQENMEASNRANDTSVDNNTSFDNAGASTAHIPPTGMGIKRLASKELCTEESDYSDTMDISSQSQRETNDENSEIFQKVNRKSTKRKKSKPEPLSAFEPIKSILEMKTFILNFNDFIAFMSAVKGKDEPQKIAEKFTRDIPGLVRMLEEVYPIIELRSLRERCKRLAVSLGKKVSSVKSDSEY